MRWETRYSSSEMAYVEIARGEVISYLNSPSHIDDRWSFDEILAGEADSELNILFGPAMVAELHGEVRRLMAHGGADESDPKK